MIDYQLNTRLNGNLAMTFCFHENKALQQDTTLYKFIWVRSGNLTLEIDHIPIQLEQDEIISLTPLQHIEIKSVEGEYLTFLFNSNFYCIFGHDDEVSCNGFLFHGSSQVMKLKLSPEQSANLNDIIRIFRQESAVRDNLQEEMLRIILKRFIIPKSAKEISELLGFEDLSTFSRFFKKMTGESVSDFRKSNTTGNIAN